jgi:hypothetical protein
MTPRARRPSAPATTPELGGGERLGRSAVTARRTRRRTGTRTHRRWLLVPLMAPLLLVAGAGSRALAEAGPGAPNVPVTPDIAGMAFQQPWVVVAPGHPEHLAIAYQEGKSFRACYLARSVDAGTTWSITPVVGDGTPYPMPAGYTQCSSSDGSDPSIAYGPDGTLYYVYRLQKGPQNATSDAADLFVITSRDAGATFGPPRLIEADDPASFYGEYAASVAVDQHSGRLYVTWTRTGDFNGLPPADGYHIWLTSSTDHGATFSPPVEASPNDPAANADIYGAFDSFLSVGPDGRVYVAYEYWSLHDPTNSLGPTLLLVSSSTDHGQTFSTPALVGEVSYNGGRTTGGASDSGFFYGDNTFFLASGPVTGTVYAVWAPVISGHHRIQFASSSDGGASWTSPSVVGLGGGASSDDDQHGPWLSVSDTGRIDLVYADLRAPGWQDVYLISSADEGATFTAPLRVTTVSSDTAVGPPPNTGTAAASPQGDASFGTHPSVASVGDATYVAWTDSRRGTRASRHQDVYFAAYRPTAPAPGAAAAARSGRSSVSPRPSRGSDLPVTGGRSELGLAGGILAVALVSRRPTRPSSGPSPSPTTSSTSTTRPGATARSVTSPQTSSKTYIHLNPRPRCHNAWSTEWGQGLVAAPTGFEPVSPP